jgi:hypothetical protein
MLEKSNQFVAVTRDYLETFFGAVGSNSTGPKGMSPRECPMVPSERPWA